MAKFRLVNCDFVNSGSFKVNVSNKAKLLYLLMLMSGDNYGFVDTTNDLINALESNEKDFNNAINLDLLENTYKSALCELIDKGYLYEFSDKHNNKVHLVRHWFFHNKFMGGLWTNYKVFYQQVHLENGEYVLGKKPYKENKKEIETKENNTNQNKDDVLEFFEKLEQPKGEDD